MISSVVRYDNICRFVYLVTYQCLRIILSLNRSIIRNIHIDKWSNRNHFFCSFNL